MKNKKKLNAIALMFTASLLSACSMVPPKEPKHITEMTTKQLLAETKQVDNLAPNWWQQFNDPQLTQLIELGLQQNLSLIDVNNQLKLAKEQVSLAKTGNKPKVNLTASGGGIGGGTSFNPSDSDYSGLGMLLPSLSYQLDFWGKNKTSIELASDKVLSTKAQQAQSRLLVSASIAQSYFVLQDNFDIEQTVTLLINEMESQNRVIESQISRGLATDTALYQNNGELDNLKTELSAAKLAQKLAKNQLALYLGKSPSQLGELIAPNANTIKQLDSVKNIPMNLLARRPDVVASQWMVEANGQNVALAKKAYYPDFNLMVMGLAQKLSNMNPADLLLTGATVGTTLPIYDGGVRDSKYNTANIQYDQAVNSYNQTVLNAVKQTSDAIISLESAHQQQQLLISSTDKYHQAYQILDKRYRRGLATYNEMNSARLKWHQQLINKTKADSSVLQQQLQLIVALGGGYQQPVPQQSSSKNQ
ncbi:efflux transporter outer membrane subunit [Vibrio sp. SS-MA-C1-2]|uniref:efflux transporter outer membrane subunit n=1 Tax=Vibrio sp. SS-MA-C1-2 TaxID=2908646 RepID=UPI001F324DDB|nr:efflux transporter outer membrane subunit [Vibrio sp. SS-MA-C1-2]UJF16954.1 efflux transporter outer membrane subunit [Vibrio sp. SS-MA-C1-2]